MVGYGHSTPVDVLRETYQYNETCQATVPEAKWGVPEDIEREALARLDEELRLMLTTFAERLESR